MVEIKPQISLRKKKLGKGPPKLNMEAAISELYQTCSDLIVVPK
jgi:hypothetical protein